VAEAAQPSIVRREDLSIAIIRQRLHTNEAMLVVRDCRRINTTPDEASCFFKILLKEAAFDAGAVHKHIVRGRHWSALLSKRIHAIRVTATSPDINVRKSTVVTRFMVKIERPLRLLIVEGGRPRSNAPWRAELP